VELHEKEEQTWAKVINVYDKVANGILSMSKSRIACDRLGYPAVEEEAK